MHPPFQPNQVAACWIAHGRSQGLKPLSAQNIRSRKRAESERINCPRILCAEGIAFGDFAISARSAESQRAPTTGSDRKAAAMIGLIVDAGIATPEDVDRAMITGRNWPSGFFGDRGGIGRQW